MANDLLTQLPFCNGMDEDERHKLLSIAEHVLFNKGQKIILQGQTEQNLWIVIEGHCQVTRRTDSRCQVNLAELEPGAHFGEMSFFRKAPSSADVIALSDMELLRISRDQYDQLCADADPVALKLTYNSLGQMAERLRKMDQWITDLICGGDNPSASEWTTFRDLLFKD